ncbi:MAG: 3-phosphoshikimate 1-carboxyvinyltransferase [Fibrobacteria bacterium]|nr:3-phosphoshikimate 1-carboxyvinyltransferase [Fibrobacteria bacterium]
MASLRIEPCNYASGQVLPPGSKSVANRVLPLAALGRGKITISNLPRGEDVLLMQKAIKTLGISIIPDNTNVCIQGNSGPLTLSHPIYLDLGNSGTSTRFLTAMLSTCKGQFIIDGIPRLRERPIKHLVDALQKLTGNISNTRQQLTSLEYLGTPGYPPLQITSDGLPGGSTTIDGSASSQFLSGLLMASPLCRDTVTIKIQGNLVSRPYIDLTCDIMEAFGCPVVENQSQVFTISTRSAYQNPASYRVEPDASSASYFLAAGAIAGDEVTVQGVGTSSLQYKGEGRFATMLQRMGAKVEYGPDFITVSKGELKGIEANMDTMSDTGMTLAVTALFAKGPTTITGIGNWRIKETDRIHAMSTELRKLGAHTEEGKDYLIIHPPERWRSAEIQTYNDHRIAMCFSLAAFSGLPVTIKDPDCVNKTYPDYFTDFSKIAQSTI